MKTYNWGIIGLGKIARKFADDLKMLPHARLHAVASTSAERAAAFAAEYGAPHHYGSYEDIVACPGLDVVYVATPHILHTENSIFCMENGLPVLCEKPFAMNSADACRMVSAAHKKRVFLMEALWSLFIPGVQKAFELIESGAIGSLRSIKADLGFNMPTDSDTRIYNKSLGAGSLLDLGIYPALLSVALLGKPERENIKAVGAFTHTEVDESCAFLFQYPGNQLMIGHSSILSHTSLTAELHGTKGYILMHPRFHHTKHLTLVRYEGRSETKEEIEIPYDGWGYHFEAAHVMQCLENGLLESDVASHEITLGLAETLDGIRDEIGLVY